VLRVLVFVLPVVAGLMAGWVATALRGSERPHAMELGRRELAAALRRPDGSADG
jgi:hypothetical protein